MNLISHGKSMLEDYPSEMICISSSERILKIGKSFFLKHYYNDIRVLEKDIRQLKFVFYSNLDQTQIFLIIIFI